VGEQAGLTSVDGGQESACRITFARRQRLMVIRADGSGVRSLGLNGSLPAWTS
jgi:hypothetical protein